MLRRAVGLVCALGFTACTTAPTRQLDPEPGALTSTLEAMPRTLIADGHAQALLVLHVRNHAGAPVPNVRATLELDPHPKSDLIWLVQPGPTDSNGKTTGLLVSETPGAFSVTTHLPAHTQSAQATLHATLRCVAPGQTPI